jgi:hypothetical protein
MRHLKPREIQGCQLALDASIPTSLYDATSGGSLVAANGAVARWEDQSGNAYHVTQSTGANQPLRRVAQKSGLDAIQFDNSNDRLINGSISVAVPQTIMAFGQTSEPQAVFADSYNSSQCVVYNGGGGDQNDKFAAVNNGTALTITNDSAYGALVATFASTGSTLRRGRTTASQGTSVTSTLNGVSVGNLRGNPTPLVTTYALGGYLCECAVWNRVVPEAVRQRINDSRSRKWRTDR